MQTKLSRNAEGVMEAAWIAAIIVVPVFFNVYSSRIFEPDKLSILRSLALIILVAWIVKLLETGDFRWNQRKIRQSLLRFPVIIPVIALTGITLLSTLLSVVPRISFFGSYQRLQGTYTMLSYVVVFAAIVGNLRQRSQVERLVTAVILASLPVSLYGVLQRYGIDPVPWGGDVTQRIASNMGNSIFVSAYLIMASPLTLGRIVESFGALLEEEHNLLAHFSRSTVYVFTASLQLIALYLSGSRGPMLGWLAGAFFFFILLSLLWRKRWMTIGLVGISLLLGIFLVVLNIPGGPLEGIRSAPWIGRFGRLIDRNQRTSRVRILIWQGAAEMVLPHEPLVYPDGSQDPLNAIRPFIGYGPESMHMAYTPFFPPELTQVEKRNASPDRSHNETWDALVTTGILGLFAAQVLFATIFYYGLKWLGMIDSPRERNLFFALYLVAGGVGAVGLVLWQGIEFFGVGLPFGFVIGLIVYLTLIAISRQADPPPSTGARNRALTLIFLLSAIVAHYVEIHFGIAIAATRTHFWVYTALLLTVGKILPQQGEYEFSGIQNRENLSPQPETARKERKRSSRQRRRRRDNSFLDPDALRKTLLGGVVIAFILITLGFDFINGQSGGRTVFDLVWSSFTRLPNQGGVVSYGVLSMLITVWIAAGFVVVAELCKERDRFDWRLLGTTLGFSGILSLIFWLLHASALLISSAQGETNLQGLQDQVRHIEGLVLRYELFILMMILFWAGVLPQEWPQRFARQSGLGLTFALGALMVALIVGNLTNLRIIRADVAFKLADQISKSGQNEAALSIFDRVSELASMEDHYYLFKGRTYLETAQTQEDLTLRDSAIDQAESDLKRAQDLNPLNPDHTANLARLYRWLAGVATDDQKRQAHAQQSADYYTRVLALAPNNVGLWGERASLYLTVLPEEEKAYADLTHALALDDRFHGTHALLGDYHARNSREIEDESARKEALEQAAYHYGQAVKDIGSQDQQKRFNYQIALAGVFTQLGDYQNAIQTYEQSLSMAPPGAQVWRLEETLASLYIQLGDRVNALNYAAQALESAPETEKGRLHAIVSQLQSSP